MSLPSSEPWSPHDKMGRILNLSELLKGLERTLAHTRGSGSRALKMLLQNALSSLSHAQETLQRRSSCGVPCFSGVLQGEVSRQGLSHFGLEVCPLVCPVLCHHLLRSYQLGKWCAAGEAAWALGMGSVFFFFKD